MRPRAARWTAANPEVTAAIRHAFCHHAGFDPCVKGCLRPKDRRIIDEWVRSWTAHLAGVEVPVGDNDHAADVRAFHVERHDVLDNGWGFVGFMDANGE